MSPKIAEQIQAEQNHGRRKYGKGPDDFAHDEQHTDEDWAGFIAAHNVRALHTTPLERRQYLLKVAGLAVSAIEAADRKLWKGIL